MRLSRLSWWMSFLVLCLARSGLAAPEAVLVIEDAVGFQDLSSPGVLEQVQRQVSRRWRIRPFQSLPGLMEREPRCDREPRMERARRLLGEIEQAQAAFFQRIDPDEARERLEGILEGVRGLPCVVFEDSLRQALSEAGLLQVRLLLMDGRPEAAATVARELLLWQEVSRLPVDHVPPEVRDFLDRTVRDRERSLVPVAATDLPEGWSLLVDGYPVSPVREWRLVAGRHRMDLLGPEEAFRGSIDVTTGVRWVPRVDLSRVFQPGPGGTLWAGSTTGPEWDRRLAEVYGVDVLRLRASPVAGTGRVEVTASARDLPRQEVLWIDLRDLPRDRLQVVRKGVLVQQVPYYWALLSGAISVGLVAAGVGLNVQANRTMDAIVGGEDRVAAWRSQRQGSITCYALGAALGVAAAALTWASHGMPARSSLLVPGPTGTEGPSASLPDPVPGGPQFTR
ncbi:MAG TPA: hypothetical protein PLQ97_05570 [Myxococcota bacterium]|nr:hypothetical protein [Myxococcota bacterium]HQK50131.1 hypothetical protein [Myxococcota bacterium]